MEGILAIKVTITYLAHQFIETVVFVYTYFLKIFLHSLSHIHVFYLHILALIYEIHNYIVLLPIS